MPKTFLCQLPGLSLLPVLRRYLLIILLQLLLGVLPGQAQEKTEDSAPPASPTYSAVSAVSEDALESLTLEQVQARIDALQALTDIDPKVRSVAQDDLQIALVFLQDAAAYAEKTAVYQRVQETAPADMANLSKPLTADMSKNPGNIPADTPLRELEERYVTEQAGLSALNSRLSEFNNQLIAGQQRPKLAQAELAEAQLAWKDLQLKLETIPTDLAPLLQQTLATRLRSNRLALSRRITMLEHELISFDVRQSLLTARRDIIAKEITVRQEQNDRLQTLINDRRRNEASAAAQQSKQASLQADNKPEFIRPIVDQNAELSQQLLQVANEIDAINRRQGELSQQLKNLEERFLVANRQLSIAGFSDALGPILRRERASLPDVSQYRRNASKRSEQISNARLQQFQIDEQNRKIIDVEAVIAQTMDGLSLSDYPIEKRQDLIDEMRSLLLDQGKLLSNLNGGYGNYINQLIAVDQTQKQLVEQAAQYARLLDENLFWIASGDPIGIDWLDSLATSIVWLLNPVAWFKLIPALINGIKNAPVFLSVTGLIALLLLINLHKLRRWLGTIRPDIGNVNRDSFWLTSNALLITLVLALLGPAILGVLGWLLLTGGNGDEFPQLVGHGLWGVAGFIGICAILRQLCRRNGLADAHFGWRESICSLIRRHMTWFITLGAPCAFIVAMTEAEGIDSHRATLGRVAFVIGSVALSMLLTRLLGLKRATISQVLAERGGLSWRSRYLWYPTLIATPVILALLALAGYYYTALQLSSRLFFSFALVISAIILLNLVVRGLNVSQRRLALIRARARRETLRAARLSKETSHAMAEGAPVTLNTSEIDLDTISEQNRRLLNITTVILIILGLGTIWDDLLPALSLLNDIKLWQQTIQTESGEQLHAISLGNVLLSTGLLVLILIIARNIPGVLEIAILQRLAMEPGNRYAITTICRYTITIIGLLVALQMIGIGWGQAQWLVAAMGVGLGFGLQEIFANFVSGLIILLEQPVRVGDTVTLGNLTGTVTRIRIRATTITDFDRKEIIIPNKAFITESLINWTLTDPVTRIIIPVGVSYDSDPIKVQEILLELVKEHPLVLDDPEPAVLFLQFGDSSLNFEVRVFARELIDRVPMIHELHTRIHQALTEHGIEIPFPQRDLHIRSVVQNP